MDILKKFQKLKHYFETSLQDHSLDENILEAFDEFEDLLKQKQVASDIELMNYKKLFENASDYIFILSRDGTIFSANAAACEKYQISYEKFINTSILQIDASQNRDAIMKNVEELLQTGSTRFEAVHRNMAGETFNLDVIAQKILWNNEEAYIHVCRDITRQKMLEKALNESEVKLKKIINQITDGLVVFENDGTIVIWNMGAEYITGIKKQYAVGKKLYELQYEILHGNYKDKDFIRERFNEVVNNSNPKTFNKLIENEIFVDGKGVRTLQSKIFQIDLDDGNQLFGSVLRDISEQKEAETRLKELLATKDKIYSIIAHDLRTPFNSIIGFTDLLLNNFDKYDRNRVLKILEFINLSAKPMLDVLTNMLHWVTTQTGHMTFHPSPQSLKLMVKEVVEMMKSSAEMKNIQLNQFLERDFIVMADVNMLQSVLQNLLANAIKFSHSGGKVDIYGRKKMNFVELEIADEGIGIDEQKKDSLFQINFQESTRGTSGEKGSGLGLILCKEFIEKHGGEIRVESSLGQGSRFIFTVPLVIRKQKKF